MQGTIRTEVLTLALKIKCHLITSLHVEDFRTGDQNEVSCMIDKSCIPSCSSGERGGGFLMWVWHVIVNTISLVRQEFLIFYFCFQAWPQI